MLQTFDISNFICNIRHHIPSLKYLRSRISGCLNIGFITETIVLSDIISLQILNVRNNKQKINTTLTLQYLVSRNNKESNKHK